jgi:hypothetical protein
VLVVHTICVRQESNKHFRRGPFQTEGSGISNRKPDGKQCDGQDVPQSNAYRAIETKVLDGFNAADREGQETYHCGQRGKGAGKDHEAGGFEEGFPFCPAMVTAVLILTQDVNTVGGPYDEQDRWNQDGKEIQLRAQEVHCPDRPNDSQTDGHEGKKHAKIVSEDDIHGKDQKKNAEGEQGTEIPLHALEHFIPCKGGSGQVVGIPLAVLGQYAFNRSKGSSSLVVGEAVFECNIKKRRLLVRRYQEIVIHGVYF